MDNSWFDSHLPPLCLAVMGGVADYLTSDEHSWATMLISMFLAGFCGYLVLLLCIEWHLSEGWKGVICGMAGLSSRAILNIMKRFGVQRVTWMLQDGQGGKSKNDKPDRD